MSESTTPHAGRQISYTGRQIESGVGGDNSAVPPSDARFRAMARPHVRTPLGERVKGR